MLTKNHRTLAGKILAALLGVAMILPSTQKVQAATCPANATATGVGVTVAALRTNGVAVGTNTVAPCEVILLRMSLVYFPIDPISLGANAAFINGQMLLTVGSGAPVNVTPPGGVPLLGPDVCTVPMPAVQSFLSLHLPYTVTAADAATGQIQITAEYINGDAQLGDSNLVGVVSGSQAFPVRVRQAVSCSLAAVTATTNCAGVGAGFCAQGFNGTRFSPTNSGPAANGVGFYRFAWTNLSGGFTFVETNVSSCITSAIPGVYQVTVSDFWGCTSVCQATNSILPPPTCFITPPTNEVCAGFPATFTVTPSGGTPPFRFNWTGPNGFTSTNQTITITDTDTNDAGVYIVTVTNVEGCTGTCQARLIVNPNPVCTVTPATNEVCIGFPATFTATPSGGTPPYRCRWLGPGLDTTNCTLTIANAQLVNAGLYTFIVTDAEGCTNTCQARLIVNPSPVCVVAPLTNEVCAGSSATFMVNPSLGTAPYRFTWSGPAGFSATNQTITITNAQAANAGLYTVVVLDAEGCVTSCQGRLIVNPNPICVVAPLTNEVCAGTSASFIVNPSLGTAPYRFSWTGPNGFTSTNQTITITNAQSINAGVYTATVLDSENCTTTCDGRLIVNPNPVCVVSPATNEVCATFSATFAVTPSSGTAPYRFTWTGPNGFTSTNQAIVLTNAQPINAGLYTATVTDAEGCTTSCSGTLIVNPNPVCTVTPPTNIVCAGSSATFTVNPSGGTAPYRVTWSGPAGFTSTNLTITIANAQSVNAGLYTVVVTDAEGCVTSCQGRLIINPNLTCTIVSAPTNICLGSSSVLTVTPNGTAPFTVVLSRSGVPIRTNSNVTGSTTFVVVPDTLGTNNYTADIRDANGCVGSCPAIVIVNPLPFCTITPPLSTVCPGVCVDLTVTPTGGRPPYRVVLDGVTNTTSGSAVFNVCPPLPGTNLYVATILDANGCPGICEARIVVREDVNADLTITKLCPPLAPPPGGQFCYSVIVSNSGNVVVSNTVVRNDQPAPNTVLTNIARLLPGEAVRFTNCYAVPANACNVADTLTAVGTDICGELVQTTSGRIVCPVLINASLQVTKLCPTAPVAPNGTLNISGRVTNTGSITLTNVTVTNTIASLGQSRRVFGPATLLPGQGATFNDSYVVPADSCGPYSDTLLASGYDNCAGGRVTASTTAECPGTNTPGLDITALCPPTPPFTNEIMSITGTLTNTGNITINNIIVRNTVAALGRDATLLGPISLAPGQGVTFADAYNVGTNCSLENLLVATGNEKCFGVPVTDSATALCPVICTNDVCPPTLVFGAISDPTFRDPDKPPGRNQAVWMRDISTNLVFDLSQPGQFDEDTNNGTARLIGRVISLTNANACFDLDVNFSGRTDSTPPGSPLLELAPSAYIQNGGPIDPSTWHYYTSFTGLLTGCGIFEGAVIEVVRYGPAFQVGAGANGKNLNYGASGWFTWRVISHPISGRFPKTEGQGDFNFDLVVCPLIQIGDFVWEDLNNNGLQDAGEPGVPGVEVQLFNCIGQMLAVTNTDAGGFYSFTNQPGIYHVRFTLPNGFSFTTANVGGNDAIDSDATGANGATSCFTVNPGEINNTIDAGLVRICPIQVLGAISDPILRDPDKPPGRDQAIWMRGVSTNLYFEASNPGTFIENSDGTADLNGRTISLTNTSSGFIVDVHFTGRRSTAPSGSPLLELDPSAYIQNGGPIDPSTWHYYTAFSGTLIGFGIWEGAVIEVTRYGPAFQVGDGANGKNAGPGASGWFTWNVERQPTSGRFSDSSGQGDFNLDFLGCPPSSVSGLVWDDVNRNGTQDGGEPGVANVTVLLSPCAGGAATAAVTMSNGAYLFGDVAPGSYRLSFTAPSGYGFTAQNAGPDELLDSDVDNAGVTACIAVNSAQANNTVAAGIVLLAAPDLRGFQIRAAGQCRIIIDGAANRIYVVEGSTDLINWEPIATVQNNNGIIDFTDDGGHPRCFYRVRLAP